VRGDLRFVLAAIDGPPAEEAVLHVATVVAGDMGLPVRSVRVVPGIGLRGESRHAAIGRVARGESYELQGRPEGLLAELVELPVTAMTVLGARQRQRRAGGRRTAGTAVALARRCTQPLLLVPASVRSWRGPQRVLTLLDGTGATALAAATALTGIRRPDTVSIPLHMVDDPGGLVPGAPAPSAACAVAANGHRTPDAGANGNGMRKRRDAVDVQVLETVATTDIDLVVVAWPRQTHGPYASVVLDILATTSVPVLLVPVVIPT